MARLKASKRASVTRARKQTSPEAMEKGRTLQSAALGFHGAPGENGANGNGRQVKRAGTGHSPSNGNGSSEGKSHEAELAEKIKELVRLAQEQGYLTYGDINDALPETLITPEDLDEIYTQAAQSGSRDRGPGRGGSRQTAEPEEEEEKARLDILDDPVRMYLKQMGQVPLLTREQEVEISKRIEDAENEVKRIDLQLRLCRQGAHRPGGKAGFRAAQGTL